jgi:aspartyl-tRNA(Asn)/glutamyl-tRNA(Gln) amidotransferase subunit A
MGNTFTDVKKLLDSGKTVLHIVENYLVQIRSNAHLNAFVEVFESDALSRAAAIDQKRKEGTAGKLAGIVIGIKDNLCYHDHEVSAASKILTGFKSQFTGTAVQRLIDEDAIVIGRLNCDEFAMGSSNETSFYGPVKNNLDSTKVPGGSSGGSAVAVSAGLCTAALGSDTGGSIRQPASFTGTYGFKPSYGRISRHGLIAYASSFDQIGPFTNCLDDAATLMEIMAGTDEFDATASSKPVEHYGSPEAKKELKVAIIKEYVNANGIDSEIVQRIKDLETSLIAAGHSVEYVSFPYLDYLIPAYYVLSTAEASSNLSRFDGVHYGYRSKEAKGVEETYKKSRSEGFGPEVKRRIMAGTFVLSQGYYDAYYTKAQKVRRVLKNATDAILHKADVILIPTTPVTAFPLNAVKDPVSMYLQDIFTVHANLTGHPAMSLPIGTHSNGMPFGVQLMGNSFAEKDLFDACHTLLQLIDQTS